MKVAAFLIQLHYYCIALPPYPLTAASLAQALLQDPVTAADGHTYERCAISRWLERSDRSPKTNLPLADMTLRPNLALDEFHPPVAGQACGPP